MYIAWHEFAVPARLGCLLAGRDVPSPVRDRRLNPQPRRPANVSQVQRIRMGCAPRHPRRRHATADTGDQ